MGSRTSASLGVRIRRQLLARAARRGRAAAAAGRAWGAHARGATLRACRRADLRCCGRGAGVGEREEDAAAVGRVGRALDEAALREPLDQPGQGGLAQQDLLRQVAEALRPRAFFRV